MGIIRDGKRARDELQRALEASNARLAALEARVTELERQSREPRASDATAMLDASDATAMLDADDDGAEWVEEVSEQPTSSSGDDPELIELQASLLDAPSDPELLSRLAERAELLGELGVAVDVLERLAGALPVGRERRRALLHAARLAYSSLDDVARALELARAVLVDHPADAEARTLVARYELP